MAVDAILSGVAATAGLLSLAMMITHTVKANRARRQKLKQASRLKLQEILQDPDAANLGRYLEEELGSFTVSEYTSKEEVRSRVDLLLSEVDHFLEQDGLDAEPSPDSPDLGGDEQRWVLGHEILDELAEGQPWNALARLRRELELRLARLAEREGVAIGDRASAGFILRRLSEEGEIGTEERERLAFAIDRANRAIHGEDIPRDIAWEAVRQANAAMLQLLQRTDGDSART